MIQELFRVGPVAISPFGVLMVVAFLAAWAQLRWGVRRLGVGDDEDASALLLAAGIGGIVGAKIYYAGLYRDWRLFFDRSGLVWYGAFILGTLAVLWVIRRRRLPRWRTLDATAPSAALGYAIGRVGCFLVGDDYGYPTQLPWGVKFQFGLPGPTTAGFLRSAYGADIPGDVPAEELVAVHPTQLYETTAGILIFLIGWWLIRRGSRPGTALLVVLALLAIERFGVEFLRAKDDRFFGPLTAAQVLSLLLFGVVAILWRRRPAIRTA
ncbi:MAG: prolipoprotein diacylglyceryl transferase [Acidobacteriota bacterium]|nr:prolipoprotein diacylglyceryl transferase [Acidobacteriota bacterium]